MKLVVYRPGPLIFALYWEIEFFKDQYENSLEGLAPNESVWLVPTWENFFASL